MEEQKEKLERIYQKLNEEEDTVLKKWYESIIPKIILLFPTIAFALTFLKVNTDKSILDLIIFIAVGGLLVTGGIFLKQYLLLSLIIDKSFLAYLFVHPLIKFF